MNIQLIVFDLDGTLFTSDAIVHKAYEQGVEEFNASHSTNFQAPTLAEILNQIGNPTHNVYKILFPGLDKDDLPSLINSIRSRLIAAIQADKGQLLPGVLETLTFLADSGLRMRVASNGHKDYIEAVLAHYKLSPFFGPPVFLNHEDVKDKGDILNLYKSLIGIHDSEMIMVGDRKSDYIAAQKAECHFIGITSGHGTKEEIDLPGALLINNFNELHGAIREINRSLLSV